MSSGRGRNRSTDAMATRKTSAAAACEETQRRDARYVAQNALPQKATTRSWIPTMPVQPWTAASSD